MIDLLTSSVFWDFDGVIKESVEVKSSAFEYLFEPFGQNLVNKVRKHHLANGGMSRYDKLPLYLSWVGEVPSDDLVRVYSDHFSKLVKQNVINSEWVPGVFEYLYKNYDKKLFFLVTATPQLEIEEILLSLNIKYFFKEIIGAPMEKYNAINRILKKHALVPENSVMIGDSSSDYSAAKLNGVPFILRKTSTNKILQKQLSCLTIKNFL